MSPPRAPAAPYHACPHCGVHVLTGRTPRGQAVTVEPAAVPLYVVVWPEGRPHPVMHQSRGYLLHRCARADTRVP
jgi:hypothetical protein